MLFDKRNYISWEGDIKSYYENNREEVYTDEFSNHVKVLEIVPNLRSNRHWWF